MRKLVKKYVADMVKAGRLLNKQLQVCAESDRAELEQELENIIATIAIYV